jgi:hypothetical protein
MNKTTITAGILLAVLVGAAIALYVWLGVIAYRCLTSGDPAVQALGAITALLIIATLDKAQSRKAHDTNIRQRPN